MTNSLFRISVLIITLASLSGCKLPGVDESSVDSAPAARIAEPIDDGSGDTEETPPAEDVALLSFSELVGKVITSSLGSLNVSDATTIRDELCQGDYEVLSVTESNGVVTVSTEFQETVYGTTHEDCMIDVQNPYFWPSPSSPSYLLLDPKIWPLKITYEMERLPSGAIAVRRSLESRTYQRNNVGLINYSSEVDTVAEELFYE